MTRRKVVQLFDRGSRYPYGIAQGLLEHPDVDPAFNADVVSFGRTVAPATPDIEAALLGADLILRCDDQHFHRPDLDALLDRHDLWGNVVLYDFKDSADIEHHHLSRCRAYVKRSWLSGPERAELERTSPPIMPLDYAMLDEYLVGDPAADRPVDFACCFEPSPQLGERRGRLLRAVEASGDDVVRVTGVSADGRVARQAIFAEGRENPLLEYLDILAQSKIVFTAFPDFQDGDSRTWEAFGSGALVVMDTTGIPSPNPPVHGQHCVVYDATDPHSVEYALAMARYLLHDDEERRRVAANGQAHVLAHHRWVHRIGQILDWVDAGATTTFPARAQRPDVTPAMLPKRFDRTGHDARLGPDFLGIGAQKAGTTWLAQQLSRHPALFLPEVKELHHFDRDHAHADLGAYQDALRRGAAPGQLVGEITPAYAVLPQTDVEQIAALYPQVRVFFSLRDPVERSWSATRMEVGRVAQARGVELSQISTASLAWWSTSPEVQAKSDYATTIRRWRDALGDDRVHVILQDDIAADPVAVLTDLFAFLGVDVPDDLDSWPLSDVVFSGAALDLPDPIRRLLVATHRSRVEALARLLDRDLSAWTAEP